MTNITITPYIRNTKYQQKDGTTIEKEESVEEYVTTTINAINGKLGELEVDYHVRLCDIDDGNGKSTAYLCKRADGYKSKEREHMIPLPNKFNKQDFVDTLFKLLNFHVVYEAHSYWSNIFVINFD